MRHNRWILALTLLLLSASCVPAGPDANPGRFTGAGTGSSLTPIPMASPTPPPGPGAPQVAILSPLQIDADGGRLYAIAQVNGAPKLAVLDARNGRLLAAWDDAGQLALDTARDRLVVDRGLQGLALLNVTSGEALAVIDLPAQDIPPSPQINARTGLVYAFRESTVYVIDPAIRGVARAMPVSVTRSVCDTPSGDAPIYRTAYDPAADRLYLAFLASTCVPWASLTIVAYDAATLTEIGRMDADVNSQFIPYNGNLYGTSVSRLGPTLYWAWDGTTQWHEESGDYQGGPAGMAVDAGRGRIYEAVGDTIRLIDPRERTLAGQAAIPLLAESQLAGFGPASDNLYFVSQTGRLYLLPAADLTGGKALPAAVQSPLPNAAVRAVTLSPTWAVDQTMAALIDNGDCPVDGGRLFLLANPTAGWLLGATAGDDPCEAVGVVAFSPAYAQDSLIFAASNQPPTILRSVDLGRSWTAAETLFPDGTSFSALILSPGYGQDQTLFALTNAGLLYRSRDGGRAWRLLDQRLDHVALARSAAPTPILFGSFGGRVLRSGDGGESWTVAGPTPDGADVTLLAAAPTAGDAVMLFAFTTTGRFVRSLDGGATWNPILETSPAPVQLVTADALAEETRPVFLLHEQAITASYDGMASVWSSTRADEAGRYRPTALAIAPDFATAPYLFVGTADGQIIRVRADALP